MSDPARARQLLSRLRREPTAEASGSQRLVDRHFPMQDQRPDGVAAVAMEALDPFLRSLLFTDGTVTRALGVQALAPVAVERLDQAEVPIPPEFADYLEIEAGGESVRRRVGIAVDGGAPVLWAESFLLPERLPPGFMGLLDGAPDGIGQSLQRVALESSRELLWFGLDAPPRWADTGADGHRGTIRRLYRIVSRHQPAILISESFAVEERAGVYRLAGLDRAGAAEGKASAGCP